MDTQLFQFTGMAIWACICLCVVLCVLTFALYVPWYALRKAKKNIWDYYWVNEMTKCDLTQREIIKAFNRGFTKENPIKTVDELIKCFKEIKKHGDYIRECKSN